MNKLLRLFHTVKYLKTRQIFWRVFYVFRRKVLKWQPTSVLARLDESHDPKSLNFELHTSHLSPPTSDKSWDGAKSFTFLNKNFVFKGVISWDFCQFGKLWTYNLNYQTFLLDPEVSVEEKSAILDDFCEALPKLKNAWEPYPLSLRIINWVKCFSIWPDLATKERNRLLYGQCLALSCQLEKHLLGNHFLENGFGLLFGAYYFQDEKLFKTAEKILKAELKEQTLDDGGHFELSPMYHQILLERVLDSYQLVAKNWQDKRARMADFCHFYAEKMLGWLKSVTFSNGDIPLVNDSALGIAPSSAELFNYADRLNVSSDLQPPTSNLSLRESGYRMIRAQNYELFCDVGAVGPDYIPGHAHADSLNFVLYIQGKPIIIDPGISTYEKNELRTLERGTAFHNSVEIDGQNSSDVWGGFRVAKRAKIIEIEENEQKLVAAHNGYRPVIHRREWKKMPEKAVIIDDLGQNSGVARFHLSPGLQVRLVDEVIVSDDFSISFEGAEEVTFESYACPDGYNRFKEAKVVKVRFPGKLETSIVTGSAGGSAGI